MTEGWVGISEVKLGILLCPNAWHLACIQILVILAIGFYGRLDQCFLLFRVLA